MSRPPRVAVVGSGIAGLSAAHGLHGAAEVTLFEAGDYFGGHTHTVDVTVSTPGGPVSHPVDTGFLVFNERTYPRLIELFAQLGVPTAASDMSFSVQAPRPGQRALEWSGSSLSSVFAQRGNLLSPWFWRMLADITRFNRLATGLAQQMEPEGGPTASTRALVEEPIAAFLKRHAFSDAFQDGYFLPMIGCIWSCPTDQMLQFPVATLLRFCHNHGLLQLVNRPRWFTVAGGAKQYVKALLEKVPDARLNCPVSRVRRDEGGVWVSSPRGDEHFDALVLACHTDQSLSLLSDASEDERRVLGAIRYQDNEAVLHTDTSVLPQSQRAWAAWNYERAPEAAREQARVCLHYLINRLQPLPFDSPVVVSLNPVREPKAELVQARFHYDHPVFDAAAIRAQAELPSLQGQRRTWFAGAWTRYGFHEDGLMSGQAVVAGLRSSWGGRA